MFALQTADRELLATARRLSDAVVDGLSTEVEKESCKEAARDALAAELQGTLGPPTSRFGPWCVSVAATAGDEGVPLLALGCQNQVHILSTLDGEGDLAIVCCLEPKAGLVLALDWSATGQRLACSCEREILVYSPQHKSAAGAAQGIPGMSRVLSSGTSWFVSHRVQSANHSSLSWGFLGGDDFILAGGSKATGWRLPQAAANAAFDAFGHTKVSTLTEIEQVANVSSSNRGLPRSFGDIDWCLRGAAGHQQVAISPDAAWVASCPAFGRVVSLKHAPAAAAVDLEPDSAMGGGRMVMLPHPRAVLTIEWLPQLHKVGSNATPRAANVLLTCCSDGVARVWKELSTVEGGDECPQAPSLRVAGKAHGRAGNFGGNFVMCFSVGKDSLIQAGVTADCVFAASWVINVVPGYQQYGTESFRSDKRSSNDGLDRESKSSTPEARARSPSEECTLLSTVTGSALCVWSVTGLTRNGFREGVRVSCIHRSDLIQQATSTGGHSYVDIRLFNSAPLPGFSIERGERKRLVAVMTDACGVVTSGVLTIGSQVSSEGSMINRLETCALSTCHRAQCRFLCESRSELSVIADEDGVVSFWWWDSSCVVLGSRHQLVLAGSIEAGKRAKSISSDGSRLLMASTDCRIMRYMELNTFNPTGGAPRVETYEEMALRRTDDGGLDSLRILGMTQSHWLCAVAIRQGGAGELWCGGVFLPAKNDSGSYEDAEHVMKNATNSGDVAGVTCLDVPDSRSIRNSRQVHQSNSNRDDTESVGFFYIGDREGTVKLFGAKFNLSSGIVSGSLDLICCFGDSGLGPVLHIRAQSLGCVSCVYATDPHVVHIWRTSGSPTAFAKVGQVYIPGVSAINSLSWTEPVPLFPLLAVATESTVYIVSRSTSANGPSVSASEWNILWGTSVAGCSSIAWTLDCRVLVTCVGGIFALEPVLKANQRGTSARPTALSSHAGYSLSPLSRPIPGSAPGLQVLHETLREVLARLPPLHPNVLHLHWSAGHIALLDSFVGQVFEIVEDDGPGARIGERIGSETFDQMMGFCAQDQEEEKKAETATTLADEGFSSSLFGGFGDTLKGTPSTQQMCTKLIEIIDKARLDGEPVDSDLVKIKPILKALVATLSGDRLDEPAKRFSFEQMLRQSTESDAAAAKEASASTLVQEQQESEINDRVMMSMVDVAWAMLSGEQEALIRNLISEEPCWEEIRLLGAPLWISSPSSLKAVAERLSKAQFKRDRDPTQCALLYLCLDKKSTLTAMFKMVRNEALHKFFQRDFGEEQHRAAAVKNAYTLLSQHRYPLASAFFLLAGQFDDAFQTILNKMDDPMLALFVARLYAKSDSGPIYEKALNDLLSKWNEQGETVGASLALWKLGKYSHALETLAGGQVSCNAPRQQHLFEHFQLVSLYTWMRNDPRVRKAATTSGGTDSAAIESTALSLFDTDLNLNGSVSKPHGGAVEESGPGGDALQRMANVANSSVVDMLQSEIRLRQTAAFKLTEQGLVGFALEQCNIIGEIKGRIQLEMQGFSAATGNMAAASDDHCALEDLCSATTILDTFEAQLFSDLSHAITERSVRASLPITLDFVHPATQQDKDPVKVVSAFSMLSDSLSRSGMDFAPAALIGSALHECVVLNRVDCHTSLSLSAGAASEGFAFLTLTSLAIPQAMKSLPSVARKQEAASYLFRLARRLTNAGSIMANSSGQPPWLGDCLHLDVLHRRISLATFLCVFMSFWHSYDTAGLQLLLCGMWDERASKSCDSAMAFSSYAQRALTRLSCLHRCEWALVWARYEKQATSLQAGCGKIIDSPYFGHDASRNDGDMAARLIDLLVLERMDSLLSTSASFGRSDDDVCSIVSDAYEAIRVAKERTTLAIHGLVVDMSFERLASNLQPYLGFLPPQSGDSSDDGAAGNLRKLLLLCDDKARMDLQKTCRSLLAQSQSQSLKDLGKLSLGRVEVLFSHKGEVLRSLCAHSDDRSGTVLTVCSNKSIREVHCRTDLAPVIGVGQDGQGSAQKTNGAAQLGASSGYQLGNRGSSDVTADESEIGSTSQTTPSVLNAAEGVLEMLWDKVSTSAAEVVHSVAEVGSQGSSPSSVGAMALAAHPWLPVFVSGGSDGTVLLWGFGAPQPLSSFGSMSGLINRMRFDDPGAKFCGCDSTGLAAVWNFELARGAGLDRRPVDLIQAHSRRCYDVSFLDNGSLIGTAGSGSASSVCVWDLLMPPSSACAAALNLHEGSANSLCHYNEKHLLISGGHKGDICVTDTRTWRCLRTVHNAHRLATRALCISPSGNIIVSGSTDGDIKFWDIENFVTGAGDASPVATWSGAHEKVIRCPSFLENWKNSFSDVQCKCNTHCANFDCYKKLLVTIVGWIE